MAGCSVQALAIVLLAVACGVTCALPHRVLLQDSPDILVDEDSAPVFQLVSNTTRPFSPAGLVTNVISSLEMDTIASYGQTWRDGRLDNWIAGNTRWNLTATFASAADANYTASLHNIPCPFGETSFSDETLYRPPGNASITLRGMFPVAAGQGGFNVTFPFLIDYDTVQSLALYQGGNSTGSGLAACANFLPPLPDFPSDWSATVELTSADRGFTTVFRNIYSQTQNMARFDLTSYPKERIGIADFANNNFTFISPANATYPYGVCNYSAVPNFLQSATDDTNITLVDTSQFLRFDYDRVVYSPGHETIRGIECEKWTMADSFEGGFNNASGTVNVTYYFPVNQWQIGRQDYHRLLKEIRVEGETDDGDTFNFYSSYVNFKPQNYTNNSAAFDVCALAPQGLNCGCTPERIARLNGLTLDQDPDAADLQGSSSSQNGRSGVCQLQTANPHGFVKSQAGPYIGLIVIGMVAGGLFTALGTWLFLRSRYAGMGHQRFHDAPASNPSFGPK